MRERAPDAPSPVRVLAIATLVAVFFSYLGLGTRVVADGPVRLAHMLLISWVGAFAILAGWKLVGGWAWATRTRWLHGIVVAALTAPPTGLFVWALDAAFARPPAALALLPAYIAMSAVISGFWMILALLMRRPTLVFTAPQPGEPPAKFLERLPLKLRGAEVWAVEAEDHYLRLHTSKGQDLILMRLADAIAELEGLEGAQVHRSWWVARAAIVGAKRGQGRAVLILKDGGKVPVSRRFAGTLRERRWI